MADADTGDAVAKALSREDLLKDHTYSVVESFLPYDRENSAIDISLTGVHKFKAYKDIAAHIKREYDAKYPGSGKATEGVYHCICGKNFASAVSHETRQFIHLKVDLLHIVLFKSKDDPFASGDA